ncbi:hypothetical protein FIBSPDRAFT_881633 [Athelia psychrophila]|uniref:Uncharacterized protein n=1 Tax=Athelia psychrophila TaxID=1759441 RepID=A0A166W6A4_9AGAM|nr:hypothetical protein FIBSPDRAFT_881633 [Fibularhizoctonia sp. CBS 109695]
MSSTLKCNLKTVARSSGDKNRRWQSSIAKSDTATLHVYEQSGYQGALCGLARARRCTSPWSIGNAGTRAGTTKSFREDCGLSDIRCAASGTGGVLSSTGHRSNLTSNGAVLHIFIRLKVVSGSGNFESRKTREPRLVAGCRHTRKDRDRGSGFFLHQVAILECMRHLSHKINPKIGAVPSAKGRFYIGNSRCSCHVLEDNQPLVLIGPGNPALLWVAISALYYSLSRTPPLSQPSPGPVANLNVPPW